jgi:rhamnose transport system permease protein
MLKRYQRELSIALAYGAVLLILLIFKPTFFHREFAATAVAAAPLLIVSVGMTLIILARHIDISIGSQFCVCAIAGGSLAKAGVPMPMVLLLTLLIGASMGAANGVLIATLGLPSIVVTLAMMVILRGLLQWLQRGQAVRDLPDTFQWFGASQAVGQCLIVAIAFAVFLLFAAGSRYLMAGRAVFAIGSDQQAARLAGIHPQRVVLGLFILMGALTALAAMLRAIRFEEVDPNSGLGLELQAVAAVVVGGTAISGGRGSLLGTLAGVALLGTLGSALGFLSQAAQWDRAIQGAIILIAVSANAFQRRGG